MKNYHLILTTLLLIFTGNCLFSQNFTSSDNTLDLGEITGTVRNSETGNVVPSIAIIILKDGDLVTGTVADEKGKFQTRKIAAGTYDLKISGTEFQDRLTRGIVVANNHITQLDPQLTEVDFIPQCKVCVPKIEEYPNMSKDLRNDQTNWIPVHILKQSLGFNIFYYRLSN